MKTFKCVAFLLTMLTLTASVFSADEPLVLAQNGKSDYRIVLAPDATAIQKSAATELQQTFREITGAQLPIVQSVVSDSSWMNKTFVIGPSELSQKLLGKTVNESAFGYDTLCVRRCGSSVVFTGHAKRGPLYAVNAFLEETLGCRWWTSTESFIPKKSTLTVCNFDQLFTPKLIYRESFYRDAFNGPFAVKMRCNGASNRIADELGGHHAFQYFVHSFYPLIPPEKYYLDHPEWFSEINGKRVVGRPGWSSISGPQKEFFSKLDKSQNYERGAQLCLTNEAMRKELVKNALAALKSNPKASFISISQNDWHGYCQCAKCAKIAEEEGSQSGVLLRFVNKVAEDIEKVRPDVWVETLAYQYTRKPPKMTRARHNVVVRLCSIECSFAQTLAQGKQNESFRSDMDGWSQKAELLFVWDYVTNFSLYLLPFPNYRVWQSNVNFFVDHRTIGLFEQGDYHCQTGDFVQLRNWVMSKLLWNPSLDQGKLMDEFIAGYYAPELVPIYRKYFDVLSDAVEASGIHLGIFRNSCNKWITAETIAEVTALSDNALEIGRRLEKQQPEKYKGLVNKIERERIPLDLVWLQDWPLYNLESRLTGKTFNGPADPEAAAVAFAEKIKRYGVTSYREHMRDTSMKEFTDMFLTKYADGIMTAPLPQEFAKLPKNSWFDIQEFDLNLFKKGTWAFIVDDSAASNKKSVKMPGTHYEWATSWPINPHLTLLKPVADKSTKKPEFRILMYARCDAHCQTGLAMTAGIYNPNSKKNESHRAIAVSDLVGKEYRLIDLGTIPYEAGQYIWAAPAKGHKGVDAVYIDRFLIIREK